MTIIDRLNKKLEKSADTVDLIITLEKGTVIDVNDYKDLKNGGFWLEPVGTSIRVQTKLTPEKFEELFSKETGLPKEEYQIINAAGLYIP